MPGPDRSSRSQRIVLSASHRVIHAFRLRNGIRITRCTSVRCLKLQTPLCKTGCYYDGMRLKSLTSPAAAGSVDGTSSV